MADDTLASQNAALATALLQSQKKNQTSLGIILLAHCIGGGKDATAWFGGFNRLEDSRARPEFTLAGWPTSFKESIVIVKGATLRLTEDHCLVNYENISKIFLTAWVNSIRGYLK